MYDEIINKINQQLRDFVRDVNKTYSLRRISPYLFTQIKDFVLRKGKRIRPLLFVIAYLGFAKRPAYGLYRSALSLELLQDFMLIHDDIIDKSATRRGKPSMHTMLNRHLKEFKHLKFNGEDLSIVVGDVIYGMAIGAFLAIQENMKRKERALKKFIEATVYTGSGEFIELLCGIRDLKDIKKKDIYKIYDFKTAYYSFAAPLAIGAILGGASNREIDKLLCSGIYLGRAFQIKDDILGTFGDEKEIGKSTFTDLQEAKKTLLIWYAYHHCPIKDQKVIRRVLSRDNVSATDCLAARKIISASQAIEYANREISRLAQQARCLIAASRMRAKYKKFLLEYCRQLLGA